MRRILILAVLFASCNKKNQETVEPITAPITEAVFAPGHLEAEDQFTLTALNDGYITDVLVEEGDTVAENQEIFKQDNTNAVILERAAEDNLKITRKQASSDSSVLQELVAQLASAREKMLNSQEKLERMQRLYITRSIAKVELDDAELHFNNSINEVEGIEQKIANTKLELKHSLIDSRSQQLTARANTDYFSIKSPGNYKIYSLLKRKGDLVKKGEALAVLGHANSLKIMLDIDEQSIAKVKLHQIVLVELNTEKNKTYNGFISKIYPAFEQATQSYKAEAVFEENQQKAINGTLLQANIIVGKKDKALLIPRSSLSPDGKVILKREKKKDTLKVQTGIIASEWVEVLGGVKKGDEIIKTY